MDAIFLTINAVTFFLCASTAWTCLSVCRIIGVGIIEIVALWIFFLLFVALGFGCVIAAIAEVV